MGLVLLLMLLLVILLAIKLAIQEQRVDKLEQRVGQVEQRSAGFYPASYQYLNNLNAWITMKGP